MDFKDYTAEDFALDKRFRKWILNPKKEDHLFWEEYLKDHPDQLEAIVEAKKLIVTMPLVESKLTNEEKATLWTSIQRDVENSDNTAGKQRVYPINSESVIGRAAANQPRTSRRYLKPALIAASLALFMTISWKLYEMTFADDNKEVATQGWVQKQNPWGQKSTIFLSDGTEVVLNSGSSLSYQKEFSNTERKVYLEGEAFFKVAKELQRPFTVISRNISTTVLGTSFNVRAFPGEDGETVSLVSGKVKISQNQNMAASHVFLEPGEQANYSETSQTISKGVFDLREVTSWKGGMIYFQDADSREVFDCLEKWYGVTIREANRPVKKWNYTGEFNNMDLHNVLSSIGFTMNFAFEQNDKEIIINYLKEP